jgi:hypothetical protein
MEKRETVSIDFDGVLHSKSRSADGMGEVSTGLISQAHQRGYAVTIMTARELRPVRKALRAQGVRARIDTGLIRYSGLPWRWYGGRDGLTVLVTHRKVAATAYIDDRAVTYNFGSDTAEVWAAVGVLAEVRRLAKIVSEGS